MLSFTYDLLQDGRAEPAPSAAPCDPSVLSKQFIRFELRIDVNVLLSINSGDLKVVQRVQHEGRDKFLFVTSHDRICHPLSTTQQSRPSSVSQRLT